MRFRRREGTRKEGKGGTEALPPSTLITTCGVPAVGPSGSMERCQAADLSKSNLSKRHFMEFYFGLARAPVSHCVTLCQTVSHGLSFIRELISVSIRAIFSITSAQAADARPHPGCKKPLSAFGAACTATSVAAWCWPVMDTWPCGGATSVWHLARVVPPSLSICTPLHCSPLLQLSLTQGAAVACRLMAG